MSEKDIRGNNYEVELPVLSLLQSQEWKDYSLLDSGNGQKLERYGPYLFIRPEAQAIWRPALPEKEWDKAHAVFIPTGEESGGSWQFRQPIKPEWEMSYKGLKFMAHAAGSRHMGVFPEQAVNWDWISGLIQNTDRPVRVLNLFGYTGLASLAAARAGAQVIHVDASKKSVSIARQNQTLSGLNDRPIRWLVDDVVKFVRREIRRGSQYDGLILDPPKFGRGPSGQVWEFFADLPSLLTECRTLMGHQPLFVILTAYAIRASAISIDFALKEMMSVFRGNVMGGELVLREQSAGRWLSLAIFARWQAD